ncbi:MAG: beta-ketoacyl-ACP synthase [Pseudomonadota bacterium]
MADQRVVITGAGNISPLGNTWDEVSERLKTGRSAVRYMQEWDQYTDLKTRLGAPIDGFALPAHYRAKRKRSMGRVAQLAVLATENALIDAGLLDDPILKSGEVGVAYGSATGSSAAGMEFFKLLANGSMEDVTTTTYIRMMSHSAPVNISVHFGIQGRMYTTTSACTAGSQGVGFAYEAIRAGQQTVMIAGGSEELCVTQAAVFDTIMAASLRNDRPTTAPRPFDRDRDGLVLGEGATTLILESLDHAQARGAKVLGEVIGFGTNTDGGHMIRPSQPTMQRVMELAVADAGIPPSEIDYVSAHATATDSGDVFESHATFDVVGHKPISALKSFTGHGLGACASFELWATINMMNEGWFAPTLNLDNVDERCADLEFIAGGPRDLRADTIMSNNFAFGGINTSLIVRSAASVS